MHGKLLVSWVTPLVLAGSLKHRAPATAGSSQVTGFSRCSGEALSVEQPDFQRHEICVSLQPAPLKVPVLLCNLCVWQMAYVISID